MFGAEASDDSEACVGEVLAAFGSSIHIAMVYRTFVSWADGSDSADDLQSDKSLYRLCRLRQSFALATHKRKVES